MIPDLIVSNPYLAAAGLVLWQVVEIWLGVKKPMDAGSIPQLIWTFIQRFHRKITKGAPIMANPNAVVVTVNIDKPVQDVCLAVKDIFLKLQASEKPQQVAQEEIGTLMLLLGELSSIGPDYVADPTSVENALALGLVAIKDAVLAARAAKAAATPAPAAPAK